MRIGDDVVRFYSEGAIIKQLPPSMAFETEPKVLGSMPKGWQLIPEFSTAADGRNIARIDIQTEQVKSPGRYCATEV